MVSFSAVLCAEQANGSILFANWGVHGGSTGGAVLEVDRDKKQISTTGGAVENRVSSLCVV